MMGDRSCVVRRKEGRWRRLWQCHSMRRAVPRFGTMELIAPDERSTKERFPARAVANCFGGSPLIATNPIRPSLAGLALLWMLIAGASCNAQPAARTQMVAMGDGVRLAT